MPRELYTDNNGNVYQRPPQEILGKFKTISSGKAIKNTLQIETPADIMFHAKIKTTDAAAAIARIGFRQGKDSSHAGYHLNINFASKEIEAGNAFKSYKRICDFNATQPVDIRIFALGDVIECFVNDAYCFTMHGYDSTGRKLSIQSLSGTLSIQSYEVAVAGK